MLMQMLRKYLLKDAMECSKEQAVYRAKIAMLNQHVGAGGPLVEPSLAAGQLVGAFFRKALRSSTLGPLSKADLHTVTIRMAYALHKVCEKAGIEFEAKHLEAAVREMSASFAESSLAKEVVPLYVAQINALKRGEPNPVAISKRQNLRELPFKRKLDLQPEEQIIDRVVSRGDLVMKKDLSVELVSRVKADRERRAGAPQWQLAMSPGM
jgi:hypothetical protein